MGHGRASLCVDRYEHHAVDRGQQTAAGGAVAGEVERQRTSRSPSRVAQSEPGQRDAGWLRIAQEDGERSAGSRHAGPAQPRIEARAVVATPAVQLERSLGGASESPGTKEPVARNAQLPYARLYDIASIDVTIVDVPDRGRQFVGPRVVAHELLLWTSKETRRLRKELLHRSRLCPDRPQGVIVAGKQVAVRTKGKCRAVHLRTAERHCGQWSCGDRRCLGVHSEDMVGVGGGDPDAEEEV